MGTYLLAFDIGTSAVKVSIVNEKLEMGRKFAAADKEKKEEEAPAEEKKEDAEETK